MRERKASVYAAWIGTALGVGTLSWWLSREGMASFGATAVQPPLSPPALLFPIVWTVLYTLMGVSAARVWLEPESADRSRGMVLFIAQLVVDLFWSLIFFDLQVYGSAFLWLLLLWGLVFWMILTIYQVDELAALLQVPYLVWLTFAAYLNAGVWILNG